MPKWGGWPPSGFGARLRTLREANGLTQEQLAERAGCNQFTVAKLEAGKQEPAWPLVRVLARALGVRCDAFDVPDGEVVAQPEARPRGRPKKAAQEAAGEKVGDLPPPQRKPHRRRPPRPRGG
jgi:transcriptional regulator with XRE-family HTH domain